MIIKCNKNWFNRILEYIGNDYPQCLYLYLDLKKYGMDTDYVDVWVQLEHDNITSVILKYYTGMHIFSRNKIFDIEELSSLITEASPDMICAESSIINKLERYIRKKGYEVELGHIGKCIHINDISGYVNGNKADAEDFHAIVQLLYQDEGIGASYNFEELSDQMRQRSEQGFVRNYVIKEDKEVVCHVCTGAEYDRLSIISGIVTAPEARGRGFAKRLLSQVCKELDGEKKEIYSVYYTDVATRLHHSVGFVDYCEYGKLFKVRH